jgi:cytochrome c553
MSPNPEAGQEKSVVCQSCHGPDGNSTDPQFPRLAGQYEDYLARALSDYKSGVRRNPIMSGFAAALSEQDIADLAAYYARQKKGVYDRW